jgi:uncharacterized BrkB/YihY/UPF0761 family membrane protein
MARRRRRRGHHGYSHRVGKSLIGWYIGSSAVALTYRAAGGIVVLLLWVYYTSQISLFGAELAKTYVFTEADPLKRMKRRFGLQPRDAFLRSVSPR